MIAHGQFFIQMSGANKTQSISSTGSPLTAPDYNAYFIIAGSLGTDNRICNDTSTDDGDSCDTMCCGRGYTSKTVQETINCGCKFQWCCFVKCKSCTVIQDRHTCLPASNNINRSRGVEILQNSARRNR